MSAPKRRVRPHRLPINAYIAARVAELRGDINERVVEKTSVDLAKTVEASAHIAFNGLSSSSSGPRRASPT